MNNRNAPYANDLDIIAQDLVAQRMIAKAGDLRKIGKAPKFVINVGDNFYPGGIEQHCGVANAGQQASKSKQFAQVFEAMYPVKELGNIEWMSVLGNHDYGGVCYIKAWDQQILYTWSESGRWVMPGQYYSRKVYFKTTTVDFWFLDNNVLDTKAPDWTLVTTSVLRSTIQASIAPHKIFLPSEVRLIARPHMGHTIRAIASRGLLDCGQRNIIGSSMQSQNPVPIGRSLSPTIPPVITPQGEGMPDLRFCGSRYHGKQALTSS